MPVKIDYGNPNYKPGRRYMRFLSDSWSQAFLRRQYLKGNPSICPTGQAYSSGGTAEDKARRAENKRALAAWKKHPKVKIKMTAKAQACIDGSGVNVQTFEPGQVYSLPEPTAELFISGGRAERIGKKTEEKKSE